MIQQTMNQEEIERIKTLINEGYITCRKHPLIDIWVLNYSNKTQYENMWEPATEMCRGLIVDDDWNIIGNSFPKFFNLFERMSISDLPDEDPIITEKLEGFYAILYNDRGKPAVSTRGTFDSPMAVWGTNWIRRSGYTMDDFNSECTYIFEIINPVLCRSEGLITNHGTMSGCFLIAFRNTKTGKELDSIAEAQRVGLPYAKRYDGSFVDALKEMPNMVGTVQEGYVCLYSNSLRIKLKCEDYHRLHRLLKGLSPKRILTTLIEFGDDGIAQMLDGVPDETYKRVRHIISRIHEDQAHSIDEARIVCNSVADLPTIQEKAAIISKSPYKSVAFAMLNGGDYALAALKRVRKIIKDLADDPRKT